MLLTVFLILPVMSLLSAFSRSTARSFTLTAVNRIPAVLARGEHTLPKLPYAYNVSLDPHSRLCRPIVAEPMLTPLGLVTHAGSRTIYLEGDHGAPPYQTPPDLRERT